MHEMRVSSYKKTYNSNSIFLVHIKLLNYIIEIDLLVLEVSSLISADLNISTESMRLTKKSPTYLLVDGLDGVTRVRVDVHGSIPEIDPWWVCVRRIQGVRFLTRDTIDFRVERLHPPEYVVKWPVLLHQHHHCFNWIWATLSVTFITSHALKMLLWKSLPFLGHLILDVVGKSRDEFIKWSN